MTAGPSFVIDAAGAADEGKAVVWDNTRAQHRYVNQPSVPLAVVPLSVPTYDANLDITHPSVVYVPDGWKGWRYWMAMTPYPAEPRENPSIVVSQDGVTWQVPTGLTNPVVPIAEIVALGFQYNSDPSLLLSPDGTQLWMYYRGAGSTSNEGLYRKTSSDGITWSAGVSTGLSWAGPGTWKLISPSVIVEADGTLSMWVVDDTQGGTGSAAGNANRIVKRTSSDGLTWSAGTTCTVVSLAWPIWHMEVKRVGANYYMLAVDKVVYRPRFLTSTDAGLTWSSNSDLALPPSGRTFDNGFNYKSSFVPIVGPSKESVQFRSWIVGVDNSGGTVFTSHHRLAFYGDLNFLGGITEFQFDRLVIPAQAFVATLGTPNITIVSSRWPVYNLDAAATEGIATTWAFPTSWRRFRIKLLWTIASGSGNVVWQITRLAAGPNGNMGGTGEVASAATTVAVPSATFLAVSTIVDDVLLDPSNVCFHIRINRLATDGNDTLATDAQIVGLQIERTG